MKVVNGKCRECGKAIVKEKTDYRSGWICRDCLNRQKKEYYHLKKAMEIEKDVFGKCRVCHKNADWKDEKGAICKSCKRAEIADTMKTYLYICPDEALIGNVETLALGLGRSRKKEVEK